MFWKRIEPEKIDEKRAERLDQVGKMLIRAAALSEAESAKIDAPFLYQRLRANIADQETRQASSWYAIVLTAPRAIPIFLIIAALFLGIGWYHQNANQPPSGLVVVEPGMAAIASSCSLTNNSDCIVSNDEMLVTIFPSE